MPLLPPRSLTRTPTPRFRSLSTPSVQAAGIFVENPPHDFAWNCAEGCHPPRNIGQACLIY